MASVRGNFDYSKAKLSPIAEVSSSGEDLHFEILQTTIAKVKEHNHPGVYLTADLPWTEHLDNITERAKKKRLKLIQCMITFL